MRPTCHGTFLSLLVALAVTGCAGRRLHGHGEARGGTQLVATDEPLERATGPQPPPQPVDSSDVHPLLAMMTHMVANDGAWRPLAWKDVGGSGGFRCWSGRPVAVAGALAARDPRTVLAQEWWSRQWVGVSLTTAASPGWAGLGHSACGDAHTTTAAASRGGLLAPAVTGRDTSVLFTTRRANASDAPGSGVVDAVIEQFVAPRVADGESRKAMPRIRPRG